MTYYERVDGMRVSKKDMIDDMMSDEQAWSDFKDFYDQTFTASEVLLMFCNGQEEFADWVQSMIDHSPRDLVMYGYRKVTSSQNRRPSNGCKTKPAGKPRQSADRRPVNGKSKTQARRRRNGQA